MIDRAEAIQRAVKMAMDAEQEAIQDAAQSLVYLRDARPEVWRAAMTHALERIWLVEELKAFGGTRFATDSEATVAWEAVGKDTTRRDAWIKERLARFIADIAPPPDLARFVKAAPAVVPVKPVASNPYLRSSGIDRISAPARIACIPFSGPELVRANGGSARLILVSQGIFRPHRLILSVPGDTTVPCEKCGHENEGPSLRDLVVIQGCVGCESVFDQYGPLNAYLFTARTEDLKVNYPTAEPGITISFTIENRGKRDIEVSGAMIGAYMTNAHGGIVG